jgi:hypothetical protein
MSAPMIWSLAAEPLRRANAITDLHRVDQAIPPVASNEAAPRAPHQSLEQVASTKLPVDAVQIAPENWQGDSHLASGPNRVLGLCKQLEDANLLHGKRDNGRHVADALGGQNRFQLRLPPLNSYCMRRPSGSCNENSAKPRTDRCTLWCTGPDGLLAMRPWASPGQERSV